MSLKNPPSCFFGSKNVFFASEYEKLYKFALLNDYQRFIAIFIRVISYIIGNNIKNK